MRRVPYIAAVFVAAIALFLAGCKKKEEPQVDLQQQKQEAIQAINHRIDQLQDNLQTMQNQADKLSEEAKAKYQKASAGMESQIKTLRERAAYLKDHAGEQWKQVQTELNQALDGLEKKFDQLKKDVTS